MVDEAGALEPACAPLSRSPSLLEGPLPQSETQSGTLATIRALCQHLTLTPWEAESPAAVVSSFPQQGRKTCRKCGNALET